MLFRWKIKPRPAARRRPPSKLRPRIENLEDRRLMTAGQLDTSFASGGIFVSSAVLAKTFPSSAVQPNGAIVSVGVGGATSSPNSFELERNNADGSLDTSFGNGGVVNKVIGGISSGATCVAIYPTSDLVNGGKIVVGGWSLTAATKKVPQYEVFTVARFNANGTLDTTFNSGTGGTPGYFTVTALGTTPVPPVVSNVDETVTDLSLDASGKIVLCGKTSSEPSDITIPPWPGTQAAEFQIRRSPVPAFCA
jgi:uncharacterized delta-60 repeat protein